MSLPSRYDSHDAALAWLAEFGPDLTNGFTSHAPMVVEALCALGRPEAALPWLEANRASFQPRPPPRAPIAPEHWRAALGDGSRTADWMALVRAELAAEPWRAVLTRWLARLAPGYCTNALHGPIRVAHAVRALTERETPLRRAELGDALGAWAADYQTLPASPPRAAARLAPGAALAAVPLQPQGERTFRGSIVSALAGLARFDAFAPVAGSLEVDADLERTLSALTAACARVYLANARDPLGAITFTHTVTAAAALRLLTPHLARAEAERLARFGFQACAALLASLGTAPVPEGAPDQTTGALAPDLAPQALADAAVAHGDDHVIKLTEACLREYTLAPDPVFLRVAQHVHAALPGARR